MDTDKDFLQFFAEPPTPENDGIANEIGKKAADKSEKKAADKSEKKAADKSEKKAADKSGKEAADKSGKKAADKSGKEAADESGKVAADESGKVAADESGKVAADESGKEAEKEADIIAAAIWRAKTMAERRSLRALLEEEEELREIYPSFSLKHELDTSEEFSRLFSAGTSLRRAYEVVNLEKILAAAMRYAAKNAGKKAADAIKNGGRVAEIAARDTAPSVKRTDVNSLTEKEIMKILNEVSRGAKITF